MPEGTEQQMAWVRKNAWSRERVEDLRAIGSMVGLDDIEAGAMVEEAAEFMLKARQAFRGGRLNVRGSARHWPEDE